MFPDPVVHYLGLPINIYLIALGAAYVVFFLVALPLGRERGVAWGVMLEAAALGGALSLLLGTAITITLQATAFEEIPSIWSFAQISVLPFALAIYFARHPATRGRTLKVLDAFAPALILTQATMRIGCLSAGCCHGKPAWGVPWAIIVDDPDTATLYRGIPVHPTQAYQIIINLAIFVTLFALRKQPEMEGRLLWLYLILYGIGRFGVELFRGDERAMVGPISFNQVVCLLFIAVGVAFWRGWISTELWSGLGRRLRLIPQMQS